jgi:predicted nucleic acid-binding protein
MPFVIDASILITAAFPGEEDEFATRTVARLARERAVSSSIMPVEVANALVNTARQGRISPGVREQLEGLLMALPIEIRWLEIHAAVGPVAQLARQYRLTAYDASYLHLALAEGLPLATLDTELRTAATAAGVDVLA